MLLVRQDDARGILRRESVIVEAGSLPGFSVHVNLATEDGGTHELQLGLIGYEPRFRFEPITGSGPELIK
jgi:hypothetical protein